MTISEISFRADADAIKNAIDIVRILTPSGVGEEGLQGLLFVVGKVNDKKADGTPGPKDGKDYCWVYSRDGLHAMRSEFEINDVQGEGAFVYLWDHIDSFKHVSGDVTFTVKNDSDAPAFTVKWEYFDPNHKDRPGASSERPTLDPRKLSTLDKRLNEAITAGTHNYKTAILRESIRSSKVFLSPESDRNAKDEYKILNIYDSSMIKDAKGSGNGTLHATDGYRRVYFHCKDFEDKGLQLHNGHVGLLDQFLNKLGPDVMICQGVDMTYAMSPDRTAVLGWSKHTKPPLEYKALPKSWDKVVLLVEDRNFLDAQLDFIKSEMPKTRDKIQIEYNKPGRFLRFNILAGAKTSSLPIDVKPVEGFEGEGDGYKFDVNIDHVKQLFDVKAAIVEFRMFRVEEHGGPKDKPGAGFRTIDEFLMKEDGTVVGGSGAEQTGQDVHSCKVTRFILSKM